MGIIGNSNEKVLAESKLYNIAKFRKIMIIIGIIFMIGTIICGVFAMFSRKAERIEHQTDYAITRFNSLHYDYEEYILDYEEDSEYSWRREDYNNAQEYADHEIKDQIEDDNMFEKFKEGEDAYVKYRVDCWLEDYEFFNGDFPVFLFVGFGGLLLFVIIGQLSYLAFRNIKIIVTDKRITGIALFGKQVELPCNQISAIAMSLFKSVAIATSSGKIHFYLIKNREEIFKTVSDLLKEKQKNQTDEISQSTSPQSTSADELAKYKSLLDSGAITQEEYDAKKKQILGL